MRLRPFRCEDAPIILSWCHDEYSFRQWSADRYERYPAAAGDMLALYCGAKQMIPLTLEDEKGVAGHLTMRYPGESKSEIRLGFVIVDDSRRGQGIGKTLLHLALEHAFRVLQAQVVSLGVFVNNKPAYACYCAAGFRQVTLEKTEAYQVLGEVWPCCEMQLTRDEWEKHTWN